jgi:tetratricopeptide (TPR) repeat protein/tRNA A-37 threonylcarbamoyl transferase component Bud32
MALRCPRCQRENPNDAAYCAHCRTPMPQSGNHAASTETVAMPVPGELQTGATFAGRYLVIEELGRGGMGRVYKVFDEKIKEKVALKLLKPEISADAQAIERFSNELRLARRIAHRHVCRMFDLGEDQGTRFITMEYVPGEDLKSVLRMMGAMSPAKAVGVARQVCEGLAEAHRLGVVHRDLKPQNIMIDREGGARIMDFGIARSLKVKGMTGAGVVIGTPEYMSPEQIEGRDIDGRSDIYSLGVILYEMTTGRVPFEGESFLAVAVKHRTELPRDPRDVSSQVPADLARLILRCLEKDRESRYATVEEVGAELARIEKGLPTTEKVVPAVKPSTRREITVRVPSRRLALRAAAILALAAAAVFIGVRILGHRGLAIVPSGKPSLAVMYFENVTGDASLDHWRKGLPLLLTISLSQSKYVRVLSLDELYDLLDRLGQLDASSYSSRVLKEVAARGGVNHVLLGRLMKAGDQYRLAYTLEKFGKGETVGTGWVSGEGAASFYPMIDALTRKVKEDLDLTRAEIAGDIDVELGKITTASPEAFLLYVEGREYHNKNDYAKSIAWMQKALAIDPGFAMAYRSMAMSYTNAFLFAQADQCLQKALALGDRISERERLLLEAEYYGRSEKEVGRAIEAYRKFLDIYPDDPFVNTKLAYIYGQYEMWDKAIERCQALIANKERSYYPYDYAFEDYLALGRLDRAREVVETGLRNVGENDSFHADLSRVALHEGKLDEARSEIEKAIAISPESPYNIMLKGNLYLYQGDLARAGAEYHELMKLENPGVQAFYPYMMITFAISEGKFAEARALADETAHALERMKEEESANIFRNFSAYCLWRSGRLKEALQAYAALRDAADRIESPGWKRSALHGMGLVLSAMNAPDKARRTAEELAALVEKAINPNETRRVDHLLGVIELGRGNSGQAIDLLKKAVSLLPSEYFYYVDEQALYFEPLALAYEKSGDLEAAGLEYSRITDLTSGRHHYGDIYARSLYRLGTIAEEKGDKAAALADYRKFLGLWKEADPGLPEIADARRRAAGLEK